MKKKKIDAPAELYNKFAVQPVVQKLNKSTDMTRRDWLNHVIIILYPGSDWPKRKHHQILPC